MISFSKHKYFCTTFLGLLLVAIPRINAEEQSSTPPQETWGSAFNKALNTTFSIAPTLIATYNEAIKLQLKNQKEHIGNQPAKPALQKAIRELMHEQNIPCADDIKILAMRDAVYQISLNSDSALPTPEIIQQQTTFKQNVLGVYATNVCIFVDEDIIDFNKNPLLSTFLVKHSLRQFTNNRYRNTILAKIGIGLAKSAALYKTIPLIKNGMENLTNTIGWTSFSDFEKNGFFLGTARFALNGIICPMIAQAIVQKLSSQAFTLYQKYKYQPVDETIVKAEEILPLIVELIKIASNTTKVTYSNNTNSHKRIQGNENSHEFSRQENHSTLACTYIDELCDLAQQLFTTKSIIDWLDTEIEYQKQENETIASILLHLKRNFFECNLN